MKPDDPTAVALLEASAQQMLVSRGSGVMQSAAPQVCRDETFAVALLFFFGGVQSLRYGIARRAVGDTRLFSGRVDEEGAFCWLRLGARVVF